VVGNSAMCCSRRSRPSGTRAHAVTCALWTSSAAGRSTIVCTARLLAVDRMTAAQGPQRQTNLTVVLAAHSAAPGRPRTPDSNRLTGAKAKDRRYRRRPNHPPLFKTPEGARQRSENSLRQRRCLSSLRLGVGARRRHAYAASARRPGRVALLLVVRGRRFVDVARGDRICLLAAVPTALQVTLAGTTSRSSQGRRAGVSRARASIPKLRPRANTPGSFRLGLAVAGSNRVSPGADACITVIFDRRSASSPCRSEESPRVCERHAVTHSDPVARIRDSGLTVSSCSQSAVGAASPLGCSCGDRADHTRPGIG
jgi:hypothetical protein